MPSRISCERSLIFTKCFGLQLPEPVVLSDPAPMLPAARSLDSSGPAAAVGGGTTTESISIGSGPIWKYFDTVTLGAMYREPLLM